MATMRVYDITNSGSVINGILNNLTQHMKEYGERPTKIIIDERVAAELVEEIRALKTYKERPFEVMLGSMKSGGGLLFGIRLEVILSQ